MENIITLGNYFRELYVLGVICVYTFVYDFIGTSGLQGKLLHTIGSTIGVALMIVSVMAVVVALAIISAVVVVLSSFQTAKN